MLTLGPFAQVGVICAGLWLFTVCLAVACIVAGMAGQRIARRHGHQCPDCDYRPPRITRDADMLIHRVLEHEQLRD